MTPDSRITPAEHRLCFSKAILPWKPGEGTGKSWHSPDFSWLMALTTTLPMGCGYHQYHRGFWWSTVGSWLHLQTSRCLLDLLVTETSSCSRASFPASPGMQEHMLEPEPPPDLRCLHCKRADISEFCAVS